MRMSNRVGALVMKGTVEEAKSLIADLMKEDEKEVAADLYRCIIGNDVAGDKRLDHHRVQRLAELVREAEQGNQKYEGALVNDGPVFGEG